MIAALIFAGSMLAVDSDPSLSVWYLQGNAARTQASFRLEYRRSGPGYQHSYGDDRPIALNALPATFAGMTVDQLYSGGTHVRFENRRDAGTIVGEGWAANGNASGNFTITLNPAYAQELQRRGIGTPTPEEQERLVLADGSYALLDALNKYGYDKPTLKQFMRIIDHGVNATYLREMHDAGFSPHSVDDIVRAQDHGVSPSYVQALRAAGVTGSLSEMIRARDHGVDAAEISGFAGLGYKQISLDELIRLRDHGVTVAYAEHLRSRGYANLSLDDLVKLRDHGI